VPLDVDPTPVRGVGFRHVRATGQPLYRPELPGSARRQRGEVGFHFADSEETTRAEWYRWLAELALPLMKQLPRDLWRFEVSVERVADLSTPERLTRVKLGLPIPDRRQWPAYQSVGETLFAEGRAGVLFASAARTDSLALCLFRSDDRLAGVRPLSPPLRLDEPPAPPRGLLASAVALGRGGRSLTGTVGRSTRTMRSRSDLLGSPGRGDHTPAVARNHQLIVPAVAYDARPGWSACYRWRE
jgi:hypothetical protein